MANVGQIFEYLNELAPVGLKMDFDNVGLLVGNAEAKVEKCLVALDITDEVIEEAVRLGTQLIVSHHPIIFGAIKSVTADDLIGRKIIALIRNNISAVCMHTNLDIAEGGVNDVLMSALKAKTLGYLEACGVDADGTPVGCGRVGELEAPMLFEDFLTSYIEDMETGRRTKKGRTVKVSPAYIKGLRIIQKQIRNYQKETHRKLGLDDMTMETRNSLVGYWKERGLMPNAINSYMTDVRTVAKAAYEDKLTKCDDFRHSDFVPKKEEVDNIYLTPEQIQEMLDLDLSTKEAVKKRLESLDISEDEKLAQLSKCRITHIRTLEHVRDIFIVGCLTGQRVSDYSRICEDMITEIGGTEFILITQQKTEKKVYIPVDRRVKAILAKYDGKLPPVHPNEMNKLVKTIGLLLGWTHDGGFDEKRLNPKRGRRFCDMLLSHTARRSFATNAYKAGVPLPSIQAITGHSSEAQLRRYLKLDAEEKAVIALKDFKGIIEI